MARVDFGIVNFDEIIFQNIPQEAAVGISMGLIIFFNHLIYNDWPVIR